MFSHYNITSWQNCCDARDCSWFYAHFLVGFGPVASQVISLQRLSAGWVPDAVMPRGFVLILLVPQPDLSWPCPNICALFHSQSQSLITIVCNEYNSSNLAEPHWKMLRSLALLREGMRDLSALVVEGQNISQDRWGPLPCNWGLRQAWSPCNSTLMEACTS